MRKPLVMTERFKDDSLTAFYFAGLLAGQLSPVTVNRGR